MPTSVQNFILGMAMCCMSTLSLSQYQHDSIKTSTGFLHYYTAGKGEPILFLQGGPGFSSFYMRALADSLPNNQCILIDYSGTGKSIPPLGDTSWVHPDRILSDLELVRKELHISKWTLVGHSYGTHFALNYVTHFPKSVHKLILISSIGANNAFQRYTFDNADARLSAQDKLEIQRIQRDTTISDEEKGSTIDNIYLKCYFYNQDLAPQMMNSIPLDELPTFFNGTFFNAYINSSWFQTWDLTKKLGAIKRPVYIIQGRQDFLNNGNPEILTFLLKREQLIYIEKCGHFPWIEQPAVFFDLLLECVEN